MKKIIFILIICIICSGCSAKEANTKSNVKQTLEYDVISDDETPIEIINMIEQRKDRPFRFSYENEDYLFIVVGYGEQLSGGYSIQVKELYSTDEEILIKTELIGPNKEDLVTMALTYPYVVIRTETKNKIIVYE